jgi:DNA-binding NtrC family response regulator
MASSRSSGFAWLLLEALVRGVGAERAALLRMRGKAGLQALLTYPGQSRVTVPRILLDRVQELGKGVRMEDGVSQLKIRGGRTRVESKLGSSLCVPLMRRGELEAILYADTQVRGAFRSLPLTVVEDMVSVCYPALLSAVHVPISGARSAVKPPRPIASSAAMKKAVKAADRMATVDDPFLVAGEPGSGREELVRHAHDHSPRRHGPMVVVACDFLPEARAESVLFGHEKGAFAGAAARKPGKLEEADCGTLLLKEIGDLAPALQLKLLRAIQEGRFYRQGGSRPVYCDVRVVGASHRDLSRMIRDEEFREDLYAQLEPRRIDVAPLRERADDLEPLIARIVASINAELGVTLKGFEPGALNRLQRHPWRRNVRELEHVLRRVLLLSEGDEVAEEAVAEVLATQVDPAGVDETLELGQSIRRVESRVLVGAMRKADGRKGRAAAILGLSREALDRRLAEYGVDLARELADDDF